MGFAGGVVEVRLADGSDVPRALSVLNTKVEQVAERVVTDGAWQSRDIDVSAGPAVLSHGAILLPIASISPAKFLSEYLGMLTQALDDSAFSGRLTPAKTIVDHHFESTDIPTLAAAIRLPMDLGSLFGAYDPKRQGVAPGWHPGAETTRAVIEPIVEWVTSIHGRTTMSFGGQTIVIQAGTAWPILQTMLVRRGRISICLRTAASDRSMRSLTLNNFGWAAAAMYNDEDRNPLAQIEQMAALLRATAVHACCGMVRPSSSLSTHVLPGVPAMKDLNSDLAAHLEHRLLHVAAGIQLITGAHLARLTDLTGWHIEDLGHDRHLLTADRLGDWYDVDPQPLDNREPSYERRNTPADDTAAPCLAPALLSLDAIIDDPPPIPQELQKDLLVSLKQFRDN